MAFPEGSQTVTAGEFVANSVEHFILLTELKIVFLNVVLLHIYYQHINNFDIIIFAIWLIVIKITKKLTKTKHNHALDYRNSAEVNHHHEACDSYGVDSSANGVPAYSLHGGRPYEQIHS